MGMWIQAEEILQRWSFARAAALGGAAEWEVEGRPDPRVLATNGGSVAVVAGGAR